jgi:hypothetical protein
MIQIKLWSLDKDGENKMVPTEINPISKSETENQLEELLVENPNLLYPNLKLIGRQTPTDSGPLDLLGIDEDGNLIIFELKRGTLSRDAVSQIIDYSSYLSQLDNETFFRHIENKSGSLNIEPIEDFENWYQENISENIESFKTSPKMVLVGLGADDTTKRMVSYLTENGIDINLITFYAFEKDNQLFLARQFDIESNIDKTQSQKYSYSKTANLASLKELANKTNSTDILERLSKIISEEIPQIYKYPLKTGYSFSFSEKTEKGTPTYKVYLNLFLNESYSNSIQIYLQNRASEIAKVKFENFITKYTSFEEDRYGNWWGWFQKEEITSELINDFKDLLSNISTNWIAQKTNQNSQ